MEKQFTYHFYYADKCNMCQGTDFKVIGKRLNQSQGRSPHRKAGVATSVMKCGTCGLIFANPIPVPQSIGAHYDIDVDDYFEKMAKDVPGDFFQAEIENFKNLYKKTDGLRGLDIGSGLGGVMMAMNRNGIEAWGIEPSKTFYDFSIKKGIEAGKLANKGIEEANYPDGFFDLISFAAVFEHLYDPNDALVHALKWLKPGGLIYISVPSNRIFVQLVANMFYRLKGLDYVSNISPMHSPFHIYEFGRKTFEKNAVLNNYSIVQSYLWTTETYFPKKLDFILKPLIRATNSQMNLTVWLRKD
jgi:SAM-dependent methyltransferase